LVIVCLLSIVLIFIVLSSTSKRYAPDHGDKMAAAALTQRLFEQVKERKLELGIPIDPLNDPNETGLIGVQHSLITTEPGELSAKLTTTNPNIAALVVELLRKADAGPGDVVAVSFSGSFPALNVAVLAAITALELEPVIITSVGSSMWGANDPAFTYLDMEKILYDRGLIRYRSGIASVGGIEDIGRGLSPEGRAMIDIAINRNGVKLIKANSLKESVEARMEYFRERAAKPIKLFINVGGGAAALGGTEIPSGIVERSFSAHEGLIGEFLRVGAVVVNLTEINFLARRYGLPAAPIPLPSIGTGKLFYEVRYSTTLAAVFAVLLMVIIFVVLRIDVDHYLRLLFKQGIKS
jgi:poly-gamma-glutamate system protein